MTSNNMWGDLSDLDIVRTPKAILIEQSMHLAEHTDGVLVGDVDEQLVGSSRFSIDLDILVPSLNNYRYTVLSARHDVELYPVRVHADRPPTSQKCDDEAAFIETVSAILSSAEVKTILSRLLSQAT